MNQVDIKFWSNKTILCFRQRHLEYFLSGRRAEMTCLFTFRWGIFSRNINALCNAFIVWTLCYWRSASAAVVVEHSRRAESQWVALTLPIPAVVLRPPNWSGAESSAKHCRRNRSIYRERKAPEVSQNANDVGFEVEWISRRKIQKNLKQI